MFQSDSRGTFNDVRKAVWCNEVFEVPAYVASFKQTYIQITSKTNRVFVAISVIKYLFQLCHTSIYISRCWSINNAKKKTCITPYTQDFTMRITNRERVQSCTIQIVYCSLHNTTTPFAIAVQAELVTVRETKQIFTIATPSFTEHNDIKTDTHVIKQFGQPIFLVMNRSNI